jgi:hypothetical protein
MRTKIVRIITYFEGPEEERAYLVRLLDDLAVREEGAHPDIFLCLRRLSDELKPVCEREDVRRG